VHVVSRREVYHLNRELLRERTRCKALEEELENPMNIHRWRKLEVGTTSLQLSTGLIMVYRPMMNPLYAK